MLFLNMQFNPWANLLMLLELHFRSLYKHFPYILTLPLNDENVSSLLSHNIVSCLTLEFPTLEFLSLPCYLCSNHFFDKWCSVWFHLHNFICDSRHCSLFKWSFISWNPHNAFFVLLPWLTLQYASVTFSTNAINVHMWFLSSHANYCVIHSVTCTVHELSLIHIWRCRRSHKCRSRWSPYH